MLVAASTLRLRILRGSQAGMPLLAETGRNRTPNPHLRTAARSDRHSRRGSGSRIQGAEQRRTRRIVEGNPRTGAARKEDPAGTLRPETKVPRQCPDVARTLKVPLQARLRGSGASSPRYGRASSKRQGLRSNSQGRTHDRRLGGKRGYPSCACSGSNPIPDAGQEPVALDRARISWLLRHIQSFIPSGHDATARPHPRLGSPAFFDEMTSPDFAEILTTPI